MDVSVNYWAVLLAAASSMVVGSIWYAKGVFGNTWAKLAHVDMSKKMNGSQMALMLGLTFIASLITAYVLAHVVYMMHQFSDSSFLFDALATAFWVWLGFTAARVLTHDLFEGRRKKLTLLTVSHEFVTFMVMALIIGLMNGTPSGPTPGL